MTLEDARVQRRVLSTLAASQVLGGVGVASGIAVMALLARRISGSEQLAGLGTTFQVLGGAVIAVPMARLMDARGRRPGLMLGYGLALAGAALVVLSAALSVFPLMLVGSLLFGGGTASNSQARYAGADLAVPQHRGRDLSIVVWATTIGSVLGPNLVGPAESVARVLRMPFLTGTFVFSVAGFLAALAVLWVFLRPDPLREARRRENARHQPRPDAEGAPPALPAPQSLADGLRLLVTRPQALLGLLTMGLGHTVMVAVMVMTPLHMDHGGATLRGIGFVISIHILGMYAFSPLVGTATDRLGGRLVGPAGAVVLLGACVMAASSQAGMSAWLAVALWLLGLGWSCTLVAGSALLTGALTPDERPASQGVADLVMGVGAAGGGAVAGVVLQHASFAALALGAAVLAVLVVLAGVVLRSRPSTA